MKSKLILILIGMVTLSMTSCTSQQKMEKSKRVNLRNSQNWHGWSKNKCPQAYQ